MLAGEPSRVPPIWLMRQAGRYHSHYQRLRAVHSFDTLCRTPELAAQVALGPIESFDFDAAILFSDLLFPLDALGLRVSYDRGRPEVDGPLTFERLESFHPMEEALSRLSFQRDAVGLTRARLSPSKGLIGFIGGPWTLFVYAVDGSTCAVRSSLPRRSAEGAKSVEELYNAFAARIVPLLIESARQQLEAGADIVMMFDTAAGALPPDVFSGDVARDVRAIATAHPGKVGYYARDFSDAHEKAAGFDTIPLAGVGLDMHRDLAAALRNRSRGLPSRSAQRQRGYSSMGTWITAICCSPAPAWSRRSSGSWRLCAPWTRRHGGGGCAALGTASCPARLRTASGDS